MWLPSAAARTYDDKADGNTLRREVTGMSCDLLVANLGQAAAESGTRREHEWTCHIKVRMPNVLLTECAHVFYILYIPYAFQWMKITLLRDIVLMLLTNPCECVSMANQVQWQQKRDMRPIRAKPARFSQLRTVETAPTLQHNCRARALWVNTSCQNLINGEKKRKSDQWFAFSLYVQPADPDCIIRGKGLVQAHYHTHHRNYM